MPPTAKQRGSKPKGHLCDLPPDELVADPRLQMRDGGLNADHVGDLTDFLKQKKRHLPRVQVRRVDGVNYVTDGFHTFEGYKRAGRKSVPCNVRPGTWEDALTDAAGANQQHKALKRSHADKRRAVGMLLSAHPDWSSRKIGDFLAVSHTLVDDIRAGRKVATLPVTVSSERDATQEEKATSADPDAKPWELTRTTPVTRLDIPEGLLSALDAARVVTAGQLVDALGRGERFDLDDESLDGLQEMLDGVPAAPKPAAPGKAREPEAEAPAAPFDWKAIDGAHRRLVGLVDAAADRHGGRDTIDWKAANRLLNEFKAHVDGWQARATRK